MEDLDRKKLREEFDELLKTLNPKEIYVIKRRYGLNYETVQTLEEIGAKLKLTRESVRQIELRAIKKLRSPIRLRRLECFLD